MNWISVKDKLPNTDRMVLCCYTEFINGHRLHKHYVEGLWLNSQKRWLIYKGWMQEPWSHKHVTHWAEIEPPKTKKHVDSLKSHPYAVPGPEFPKRDAARIIKLIDDQRVMFEKLKEWKP